jgi:hypothetical protein
MSEIQEDSEYCGDIEPVDGGSVTTQSSYGKPKQPSRWHTYRSWAKANPQKVRARQKAYIDRHPLRRRTVMRNYMRRYRALKKLEQAQHPDSTL